MQMLEAVLDVCNKHARIPACGMISQYNKTAQDKDGVTNLFAVRFFLDCPVQAVASLIIFIANVHDRGSDCTPSELW